MTVGYVPFEARPYIGWISPQGEFYLVDMYVHEDFAEDKVKEIGYAHEDKCFGDVLRNNGWIRVTWVNYDDSIFAWSSIHPLKAALDQLFALSAQAEKAGHVRYSEQLHNAWKALSDNMP